MAPREGQPGGRRLPQCGERLYGFDLGPLKPLQDRLYDEMLSHIKQTDENVPYREGDWYYISKTEEGKQSPILARKRDTLHAEEEEP